MSKKVKTFLAIVLSLFMVVSTVTPAFAAEDENAPLTIDVSQITSDDLPYGKLYLSNTGSGNYAYCENGYILTGKNESLEIYIQNKCDVVTLRDLTITKLQFDSSVSDAKITIEGDNYLKTLFAPASLTVNGGKNDSLTIETDVTGLYCYGKVTVNGGNIKIKTTTTANYPTISGTNGFYLNGGEVTLENNYFYVVGVKTYLNGGKLNVISGASSEFSAINSNIEMNSGAELTVDFKSCDMMYWNSKITVSSSASISDPFLFGKFDDDTEFKPIATPRTASVGKTYAEFKVASHAHSFNTLTVCDCGLTCSHYYTKDNICERCGAFAYKITHQPTATEPYVTLNDDTNATYQWYTAKREDVVLTDQNTTPFSRYGKTSTYSSSTGWKGFATYSLETNDTSQYAILIAEFKAGDTVTVESEEDIGYIEMPNTSDYQSVSAYDVGKSATLEIEVSGVYVMYIENDVSVKCTANMNTYTAISGETAATLSKKEIGKNYVCKATVKDSTVITSEVLDYDYKITHQPTVSEPYVTLNDDTNVTYQWYKVTSKGTEITNQNASAYTTSDGSEQTSTYSSETGWSGVSDGEFDNCAFYFTISLKKGETIRFNMPESGEYSFLFIMDMNDYETYTYENFVEGKTVYELTAPTDGDYAAYTDTTLSGLKATLLEVEETAITGETAAKLSKVEIGKYVCKITTNNGSVITSDVLENPYAITHQPTEAEPYVKLNDSTGAKYQWYKVTRSGGAITDQNATPYGTATYSSTSGWSGFDTGDAILYFTVSLKKGQKVEINAAGNFGMMLMVDFNAQNTLPMVYYTSGVTSYKFTATADGDYTLATYYNISGITATIGSSSSTAIGGETASTLSKIDYGFSYYCTTTANDGSVLISDKFSAPYKITHQPKEAEPYVKLNDSTGAKYQWYKVTESSAAITDQNATPYTSSEDGTATYSSTSGWSGVETDNGTFFFTVSLKAGQKVEINTDDDFGMMVMIDFNTQVYLPMVNYTSGVTSYEFTASLDGNYTLLTYYNISGITATTTVSNAVAISGETAYKLASTAKGEYVCEVNFKDGTTERSNVLKITKDVSTDFDPIKELKLIRSTASIDENDVITLTLKDGKNAIGVYKKTKSGYTCEITSDNINFVSGRTDAFVAYASENGEKGTGKITFTLDDGTTKEYTVNFKFRDFDPIKELKLIRSTASIDENDVITLTLKDGKNAIGVYKNTKSGYTCEVTSDDVTFVSNRTDAFVAYASDNYEKGTGKITFTLDDGTTKEYTVKYKFRDFDPIKELKLIRSKATLETDENGEYILVKKNFAQNAAGVYVNCASKYTCSITNENTDFANRTDAFVAYAKDNEDRTEETITFNLGDGQTKTYRIVFDLT